MATIIFGLLPHYGHINSSLVLAGELTRRGHKVIYVLTNPHFKEHVEAQGFEFRLFDLQPKNAPDPQPAKGLKGKLTMLKNARGSIERIKDKDFVKEFIDSMNPDLIVLDSPLIYFGIVLKSMFPNVVFLNTSLLTDKGPGIPPMGKWTMAFGGPLNRLKIAWQWFSVRRKFFFSNLWLSPFKLGTLQIMRELAKHYGYDLRANKNYNRSFFPGIKLPELIAAPKEFDFPRPDDPMVAYGGPGIKLDRKDPPLDWSLLDMSKSLIYSAFGTITYEYKDYDAFVKKLIRAYSKMPEYTFLMAIGEYVDEETLAMSAPNVHLVKTAPQLEVLQKAEIFVSHSGTNGVKEAAFFGVPQLFFPLANDGLGISARAVYHGLGIRARYQTATEEEIQTLVREVLNNPIYRENTLKMQKHLRDAQEKCNGADWLESLLEKKDKTPQTESLELVTPPKGV